MPEPGAAVRVTPVVAASGCLDRPMDRSGCAVADSQVMTSVTPGGFGTPFHVVGSTDVITPKHVEVVCPGTTDRVTTFDVPGFSGDEADTVHCSYTDPAGLFVDLIGRRA
jgi:hypothetical protein